MLKRQMWSPFEREPVEFAELNFDFHPIWLRDKLAQVGFCPGRMLTVSHFRMEQIKRLIPTSWLVKMDSIAQNTGRWWQLSPSVFLRSRATAEGPAAANGAFFACPDCQSTLPTPAELFQSLAPPDGDLVCPECDRQWPVQGGIFIFK